MFKKIAFLSAVIAVFLATNTAAIWPVISFKDITNDHAWAQPAIQALVSEGIISGKESGVFAPDQQVTKEEFAKMLTLSLGLQPKTGSVKNYIDLVNSMRTCPVQCLISQDAWAETEAMSMHIPAMILQPLVENAIKHGIGSDQNGMIHISVARVDDVLCICVEDNGRAMSGEQVEQLNRRLQMPAASPTEHIGIQNVARRLSLSYPNSSTLTFESIPNIGVSATITVRVDVLRPAIKVENIVDSKG